MPVTHDLSGALTCTRYAFAPNFYHYCGPDTGGEIGDYLKAEFADGGMVEHLARFETLYPYLESIAHANGLADPLDPRVVDAYWVGNPLLERVTEQATFIALSDKQNLKKRLPKKEYTSLLPKIDRRSRLHHSFHVLNVFTRTGHATVKHTVDTMDQCLIQWGTITKITPQPKITLSTQKLAYQSGKLSLNSATREVIIPGDLMAKKLKVGDQISYHWGFVCDRLTASQVKQLEKYTLHHLELANETL